MTRRWRKNAAGGYIVTGLGAAHPPYTVGPSHLEHWLAAVNAQPGDGWSGRSKNTPRRLFRRSHPRTERERAALALRDQINEIMRVADGLTSYEVAAVIGRSVRTARRFLAWMGAKRLYRRVTCRRRIWTQRYGPSWSTT